MSCANVFSFVVKKKNKIKREKPVKFVFDYMMLSKRLKQNNEEVFEFDNIDASLGNHYSEIQLCFQLQIQIFNPFENIYFHRGTTSLSSSADPQSTNIDSKSNHHLYAFSCLYQSLYRKTGQ